MADSGYSFDRSSTDAIVKTIRRVRQHVRPRQGQPDVSDAVPSRPNLQWVKVSSLTPTSGRYAGNWAIHSSVDNSVALQDAIWVMFPNNDIPQLGRYYLARQDDDANGRAVYSVVDSASLPISSSGGGDIQGGLAISGLGPPGGVSAANGGGASGTTYTYGVTGVTQNKQETSLSISVTVNNQGTLDLTHTNTVNWTVIAGIYTYNVYQITPTYGLVGTVTTTPGQTTASLLITSNTITAGTTAPAVNQTPTLTAGLVVGGSIVAPSLPQPKPPTVLGSTAGGTTINYQVTYILPNGTSTLPSTALSVPSITTPSNANPVSLSIPLPANIPQSLLIGLIIGLWRVPPNTTGLSNGLIATATLTSVSATLTMTDSGQPVIPDEPGAPPSQDTTGKLVCALTGGMNVQQANQPAAPLVTPIGTTGATTYSYAIAARDATGSTGVGPNGTTTTGNASLTAGNYNQIVWQAIAGALSYDVYRQVGGATQGLIGNVPASQSPVFLDQGGTAGAVAPVSNTTGAVSVGGVTIAPNAVGLMIGGAMLINTGSSLATMQAGYELGLAAGTVSQASLNVPPGSGKSSPADGDIWYDGTHFYFDHNGALVDLLSPPVSTASPTWKAYAFPLATLQSIGAVTTGTLNVVLLSAKGVIEDAYMECVAPFTASGLVSANAGVGWSGSDGYVIAGSDVFSASAGQMFGFSSVGAIGAAKSEIPSMSASTQLLLKIILSGANCSALLTGSLIVWLKYSVLP